MTIDVGTGDGRAVLDAAAREPATLVLGLDASASALADASRRAARPAHKGGRPNARFIVAAAEAPPTPLLGIADLVTVQLPWGSLLRGMLGCDDAVAAGVAGLVKTGGAVELLVAPAGRDGLDGLPTDPNDVVQAAARTFVRRGFRQAVGRPASIAEIRDSGSTWAKRLLSAGGAEGNGDRRVLRLRLVRS